MARRCGTHRRKKAEHLEKVGVRSVTTNQDGLYKNLETVVRKYATTAFLRPVAKHTQEAFEEACKIVANFKTADVTSAAAVTATNSANGTAANSANDTAAQVVLDSGCGTGESTLHLARKFTGIPVLGLDKSATRLNHSKGATPEGTPENAFWLRAELQDFWKLALEKVRAGEWYIPYHALYYPNPWPKQSEATRRFHLHPVFPTFMELGNVIELRTNWEIYAREFEAAARLWASLAGKNADIACEGFVPDTPETAFERKYNEARQQLWRVIVKRK